MRYVGVTVVLLVTGVVAAVFASRTEPRHCFSISPNGGTLAHQCTGHPAWTVRAAILVALAGIVVAAAVAARALLWAVAVAVVPAAWALGAFITWADDTSKEGPTAATLDESFDAVLGILLAVLLGAAVIGFRHRKLDAAMIDTAKVLTVSIVLGVLSLLVTWDFAGDAVLVGVLIAVPAGVAGVIGAVVGVGARNAVPKLPNLVRPR